MLSSLFKKTSSQSPTLLGIEISPQGVALAEIDHSTTPHRLSHCQFHPLAKGEKAVDVLAKHVQQQALQRHACSVVLHPSQYQLIFVDRPEEIPNDELAEALRWRIKDLIQMPVNEAVIDFVSLPDDAFRGRMQMVYVAIAQQKFIHETIEMIKNVGLELRYIDIAEMALRNLALLLPEQERGFGIIHMESEGGMINLMERDALYLSRRGESGLLSLKKKEEPAAPEPDSAFPVFATMATANPADALLLELQRSLDYYESQLGKGGVGSLYFTPTDSEIPTQHLSERLGLPVSELNLGDYLQISDDCPKALQQQCIRAIGAALRRKEPL
ncbi:hypothetical protein [Chrysiogenes arsenatis]|uniref:hypothetical protein n=1 Tax=Chrysiogenes arsenatis TaxID=309797 RepID=UPI0004291201|nr:hypothetical protein [Chrysiogenes arsenatis]